MTRKTLVVLTLAVLLIGVVWQFLGRDSETGVRLPYDRPESVARGASIYAENCASCHGADLQGQPDWKQPSPEGLMPAPPHDESGHTWHHPDEVLFRLTKLGTAAVVGQGYESNMPGFSDTLSDQDILDVLGFIKSTWPPEIIEMNNGMNNPAN